MNNLSCFITTPRPTRSWVESNLEAPLVASKTKTNESSYVVMCEGKNVTGTRGQNELLISIDPKSLTRKLAVIEMAAHLDGQAVTSTTGSL